MKSNLTKFAIGASIMLALAFTFGCYSGGDGSGEQSYNYCITAGNTCHTGPFTASTCTGQLSNNCPYHPTSSSSEISSSSSKPSSVSSSSATTSGGGSSSSSITGGGLTGTSGTITDSRDNKPYKWVKIGEQYWLAENLNYAVGGKCYGEGGKAMVSYDEETDTGTYAALSNAEIQANCAKYGRLYYWATAMDIEAKYNNEEWGGSDVKHQGICPSGWHIPSNDDWDELVNSAGGASTAGTKLKAREGWEPYSGVPAGTDEFGFSALSGGYGFDGGFFFVGYGGYWLSASEGSSNKIYGRYMLYYDEDTYWNDASKDNLFSVRCVKD